MVLRGSKANVTDRPTDPSTDVQVRLILDMRGEIYALYTKTKASVAKNGDILLHVGTIIGSFS